MISRNSDTDWRSFTDEFITRVNLSVAAVSNVSVSVISGCRRQKSFAAPNITSSRLLQIRKYNRETNRRAEVESIFRPKIKGKIVIL
jgi:hypothetical protein